MSTQNKVSNNPVSIIIPVGPNSPWLKHCLSSVFASDYENFETILVVDKHFVDKESILENLATRSFKVKVEKLKEKSGPAAARNLGATIASSEILLFLDSDIQIKTDTVTNLIHKLNELSADAVFGSYSEKSIHKDFWSSYKQLLNYYTHQLSAGKSSSFWGACSAIKKDVFIKVGGFNEEFSRPSIEDIELGYKLRKKNYQVYLLADIQVDHLKQWTFLELLTSDLFDRALPWARLVLANKAVNNDLNLKWQFKVSAIHALLILIFLIAKIPFPSLFVAILLGYLILNYRFYLLCRKSFNLSFLLKSFFAQFFYYLYSLSVFLYACLEKAWKKVSGIFA